MAWLTQAQMAELYQTSPQNITMHLKAVFKAGELNEATTCKDFLQVRTVRFPPVHHSEIPRGIRKGVPPFSLGFVGDRS
jgi:hypothetical protein